MAPQFGFPPRSGFVQPGSQPDLREKPRRPVTSTLGVMRIAFVILTLMIATVASANPCDGIDRSLSQARKIKLAPVIAKEEKVAKVEVLQSFRSGNWYIIYIENHVSDEPFLFYDGDPMTTKSITAWSGAATIYEEQKKSIGPDSIDWHIASCTGKLKRWWHS